MNACGVRFLFSFWVFFKNLLPVAYIAYIGDVVFIVYTVCIVFTFYIAFT